MAFETASSSSSSSESVVTPKELLFVLSSLNEKQKLEHKQRKEQAMQQQQHQHHRQQHLLECEPKGEREKSEQYMELSQIEMIYRAEGNANLVLALPQFKKVLRLPKVQKQREQKQMEQQPQYQDTQHNQKYTQQHHHIQKQQKQQDEPKQQKPNKILTAGQQQNNSDAVGILTMDHYVAYISIIRCLVGNEFVFEADIVAVPNPNDRNWINEHIKPYRPANRLDKEFSGHFGLLLPDATQLPAEFDILFFNLQRKTQPAMVTPVTKTLKYSNSGRHNTNNNIFGSDTFAIEIKPKQGWLLPNDLNILFDIKPKMKETTTTLPQPNLSEPKITLKAAVATTIATTATQEKTLKSSTDSDCFTTTQSEPLQKIIKTTATTAVATTMTTTTSYIKASQTTTTTPTTASAANYSRWCSSGNSKSKPTRDDKISHPLYDKVDTRCRYCCMQFLKMKQQKIYKKSQYCPLDLFSGNTDKMLYTLQNLFECPQNNLRLFKNGNIFFDDQISRSRKIEDLLSSDKLQLLKHLVVTCLLREYDSKGNTNSERIEQHNKEAKNEEAEQMMLHESSATVSDVEVVKRDEDRAGDESSIGAGSGVVDGQPHSSVTSCKKQKLKTMPEMMAPTNTMLTETEVTKVKSTLTSTEPVFTLNTTSTSTSAYSSRCLEQINQPEMTCLPKDCVLHKILYLQLLAKNNLQFMLDNKYAGRNEKSYDIVHKLLQNLANNPNKATLSQLSAEEQYILAATAMDCSIMITFCEIENVLEEEIEKAKSFSLIGNPYVVSMFGKTFLTKVTLLDLDPKPDTHFNKYTLQTKLMVDAINEL